MTEGRIRGRLTNLVRAALVSAALLAGGCAGNAGWVGLFNGETLDGWKPMRDKSAWQTAADAEPDAATANEAHQLFVVTPGTGILVNGTKGRTCNIHTVAEYGDCEAHIEFMVPKGSNSGVYFLGKYEIQVFDSFGKADVTFSDCGGIYARWVDNKNVEGHPPKVNASKAPGEWQTFDAIFKAPRFDANGKKTANARFVKIVHNGKVVHEDLELYGPTRAHMPGPEVPKGPLMLQGDHGPVAFRNLRVRPLGD